MNFRANASHFLRTSSGESSRDSFDHFVFDRKAVTIPARDVRRALAEHRLRFHHEILENFVERSAHVHIAVGEWRAVMQNEQFPALSRFLNLLVKPRLLPSL